MDEDVLEKIPGVLACDVGNSAVHFAAVRGDRVGPAMAFRAGNLSGLGAAMAEVWAEIKPPRKIVAASVRPASLKALEAAAAETLHEPVLVVGRDLPLPIETDLPQPQSIGTDRLCAAAAAYDRLGAACVVADFGTAVTIDCVNDDGVFLGGAILPGIAMGAAALHERTAQLPQVEPVAPDWVLGKDTRQAIIGGLVFGARGALRELAEDYAVALGHWPIVVITGGDAHLICADPNRSELVRAVVPDLAIRGVAIAYYRTLVKRTE